jgi:hypothetical protein
MGSLRRAPLQRVPVRSTADLLSLSLKSIVQLNAGYFPGPVTPGKRSKNQKSGRL